MIGNGSLNKYKYLVLVCINKRLQYFFRLWLFFTGKDVKILPPSTRFYVASTTRQNFNAVSRTEK